MGFLDWLTYLLQFGILAGFLPYSLLLLLARWSKRFSPVFLNEFDAAANKVIIYSGIIVTILLSADLYSRVLEMDYERWAFSHRIFPLWTVLLSGQILVILLLTQLLRVKVIRKQIWFRALVSVAGIGSSERIFRFILPHNNNYLPSRWVWYMGPMDYLIASIQSIISIVVVTAIVYFLKRRFERKVPL